MSSATRYWAGRRVEIPPYHDAWMRGDRYGCVQSAVGRGERISVRLDRSGLVITVLAEDCVQVTVIPSDGPCAFTSPCSPEPTRPCEKRAGHGGPHGYLAPSDTTEETAQ